MQKLLFIFFIFLPQFVYSIEPHNAFIELAKKVRSSVVNISTTRKEINKMIQIQPNYIIPYRTPEVSAAGSGFILDKEGLIITNAHVVKNFDQIQVQFSGDSKYYPAKILGSDDLSDIALLKVKVNKKLIPFKFGDSEKLQVGEWVAAIGNPHGYGHTMTKGIISAMKREIDDLNLFPLLQTDASINPGNSGGPLVNLKGEVVGINQAIARGATGISFAIPINNVKEVLKDLKSYGFVRRGFIGIEFRSDGQKGALVTNVVQASPAKKAGIKVGDRIIKFSQTKIRSPRDLPKAIRKTPVNKSVSLKILRNNEEKTLSIQVQMIEKNSFSFPNSQSSKFHKSIRGKFVSGGFQVMDVSPTILNRLNQPDLGAKHPIVVSIKENSPASKGGLTVGDLIYKLNGKQVSKSSQLKSYLSKGMNRLRILRYHHRYDQYLAISVTVFL